ncbi:MAG TPA: hypothetical protein VFA04_14560 [Bryobacteraceae bacterium]|nr:hypothetical protein [Bryobacteraceae bacterium]
MRTLFRAYACLFEIAVSLVLIALAVLAYTGDVANFRLPILPLEGAALARATLALGIVGLVMLGLPITGVFRPALPIWSLIVFVLLFRGWFASAYTFANSSGFSIAVWITAGALLAFILSFAIFRRATKKI